jgi:hypothetical protein
MTVTKYLTPKERIICAYQYFCLDMTQEQIKAGFPLVNAGRVNEAIKAIEKAANNPKIRQYHERPRRKIIKRRDKHGRS